MTTFGAQNRPNVAALELSRFVLLDACPARFLARCLDELLVSGVKGVVSFADLRI
jgi:hypothetical protein